MYWYIFGCDMIMCKLYPLYPNDMPMIFPGSDSATPQKKPTAGCAVGGHRESGDVLGGGYTIGAGRSWGHTDPKRLLN